MTKEEIKNYIENIIEYNCSESDLEREDVLYSAILTAIYHYELKEISKEDLLQCADYLEFALDMEEIDKAIEKRRIAKEKRKARKEQKKLCSSK